MAQGDTATVLATAMLATFNRIPFLHVEAGLRSHDLGTPFPEEYNRRVAAINAQFHYAPTAQARDNLLREGIPEPIIQVTGNTVVDALMHMRDSVVLSPQELPIWWDRVNQGNTILITSHRRENQGKPLLELRKAVLELAKTYPDLTFLWLTHPNPAVAKVVSNSGLHELSNLLICEPVDYLLMVQLYGHLKGILTDSGGIQEEAPTAGVPVVILRQTVERTECLAAGYSRKALPVASDIVAQFEALLSSPPKHLLNPYGDGKAAGRILDHLQEQFTFLKASSTPTATKRAAGETGI